MLRLPRRPAGLPARIGGVLARVSGARPGAVPNLPVLRRAELALARTEPHGIAKRKLRVPEDAFVPIGPQLLLPPPNGVAGASPPANDNARSARPRFGLRDLVLLSALAATLLGVYYQGRMHAFQKVIVVPQTGTPGARITDLPGPRSG